MDEQIAQFISVTSATPEVARTYLTQSNGNIEEAINTYLAATTGEDDEIDDEDDQYGDEATSGSARSSAIREETGSGNTLGGNTLGGGTAQSSLPDDWAQNRSQGGTGARVGRVGQWGSTGSGSGSSTPRSGGGPKVATFGSLASSSSASMPSGGDDSDKEGEDWYAGGERSGINVQNPDRAPEGRNGPGIVSDILKKARQAGPPPSQDDPSSSTGAAPSWGSGNTLGSDVTESVAVPDPNRPTVGSAQDDEDEEDDDEVAIRHLTFWRNGFSLEDGSVRAYDAPGSREILEAINNGTAPLSILNIRPGQQVEVRVQKRLNEEWQPAPPKPRQPFDGTGNRLGAPVPSVASSSSTGSSMPGSFQSTTASTRSGTGTSASASAETSTGFEVDQDKPVTSLQIRLGDGTRMPAKVNLTHTVGDLRRYIDSSRPAQRQYVLQTTFPNKDLTDDTQTIEQAGLKNAVIVQRWV
ncbi:Protein tyrosine phosphatase SHP1/Cofactor for p97 ATPase-mediated vesicle membrane fusion [Phaffia rhodozyma]|uniref:Protein tyrosine phosphatase SHP1/Cofactor for p97 ATPase-mediated vesicle membrane fusion n=1 Tax=Phaffia rhodozyma TaxID=264483 RepID=A0A0F7SJD7_PHARH|nr:Protein tyrosine phosphatase SHP1/Cofactor for p97 ATPase-mediated vesicle membrane fusion [Phaffia rhodozyma]